MAPPRSLPSEPDLASGSRRPVDERALAHHAARLRRAGQAPWLHAEAARRMAERLTVIRSVPQAVLDWWPAPGGSSELLARAYPRARRIGVEPQAAAAAPWWSPRRWAGDRPPVAEADVPAGQAQLVWANMMLHATPDPQAVMAQWQRALAVDGFLMFSTLGPGTLEALSALYRQTGWPPPFAPFVDMHDLGDMLVHAGFADPVMDQETLTLTWPDGDAALAELRTLGGNADPARHAGLRTPRWRRRLADALPRGADGRPALRFEIVYGHAFRPLPRARVAAETSVSLDDLRTLAKAGRKPAA